MYSIILFGWFLVAFLGYNLLSYFKFGLLPSISDSHYSWHEEGKENVFLLGTWLYALPALFLAESGFLFFAAGLLFFVGIASDFRMQFGTDITQKRIHEWGAMAVVVLALLSEIFDYKMFLLAGLTVSGILILQLLKCERKTLWQEMVVFVSMSYCIYINIVLK